MGASVTFDTIKIFENDWLLLSDFIDMWCDYVIGQGSHRRVYQFSLDKTLVVKIDTTAGDFPNVSEWDFWSNMRDNKEVSKYLAPCIQISNAGKIMLQKKTEPITDPKLLPKNLPAIFADTKIQNWGILNGKPVCHDYCNHKLYSTANTKLVNIEWFSDKVSAPIKYMKKP